MRQNKERQINLTFEQEVKIMEAIKKIVPNINFDTI